MPAKSSSACARAILVADRVLDNSTISAMILKAGCDHFFLPLLRAQTRVIFPPNPLETLLLS
jgi:hypothetical protein